MEKTYTITQEQMENVFETTYVIESLRDAYEKKGNEKKFHKLNNEWLGRFCTIVSLGWLELYTDYKFKRLAEEQEA